MNMYSCKTLMLTFSYCYSAHYNIYREIVTQYGLWNQIRVDHGREWFLMLFGQQHLQHLRHDTSKPPFVQTSSKKVFHAPHSNVTSITLGTNLILFLCLGGWRLALSLQLSSVLVS